MHLKQNQNTCTDRCIMRTVIDWMDELYDIIQIVTGVEVVSENF